METVIELLKSAKGEIIGGVVLALLGWLCNKYCAFMKMYRLRKKELERMEIEMFKFGNTKKEIERLKEALRNSEAKRQDTQSQLEASQQELQRKSEALKQAEAKLQEDSRHIEALQQELEREKAKKKIQPMSDKDFIKLCESGDVKKVEEAIMNGANVNAKVDYCWTALMKAAGNGHTQIVTLLLKHGADINAEDIDDWTALSYATRYSHTETANLLRSYGAK